jgi:uncharacterized LabA/DUF88 family protein
MDALIQPLRVVVFIDAQNVYRDARRAFFDEDAPSAAGQVDARKYSELLVGRVATYLGRTCELRQIRMYAGRPDAAREPISASSMERQVTAWEALNVVVSQRPLRYPSDWPNTKAQQKGVDVQIGTDLVQLYLRQAYDIGVVATTDTDLRPAVEAVMEIAGTERAYPALFTCAWNSPRLNKRLWLIGRPLYCFFLRMADYDAVCDSTRYGPPRSR